MSADDRPDDKNAPETGEPTGEAWLWDRTGPADQDIDDLEAKLRPLRIHAELDVDRLPDREPAREPARLIPLAAKGKRGARPGAYVWMVAGFAAAALVFLILRGDPPAPPIARTNDAPTAATSNRVGLAPTPPPHAATPPPAQLACDPSPVAGDGLRFSVLEGIPSCDGAVATKQGVLAEGKWMEADAATRVKIEVADIGHVEIDRQSRVRVIETGSGTHQLELARGRLEAKINAPPRIFVVTTPAAKAVDLGCEYELVVDETGAGTLKVETGYVELEPVAGRGRLPSLVPFGATCAIDPVAGPGLPIFDDAPPALRDAVRAIDARGAAAATIDAVLAGARKRDTLTIVHLLERAPRDRRAAIFDKLEQLAERSLGVDREAIVGADATALRNARNALAQDWLTVARDPAAPPPPALPPPVDGGVWAPPPPTRAPTDGGGMWAPPPTRAP